MRKRLRFSPLVAHAQTVAVTAIVCAKYKWGDQFLAAAELFSGSRAFPGKRPDCFGGSGEIRTRDQRIKSPLLYRLSYRPPFEEGRMLATTPPTVKPQSSVHTVIARRGVRWAHSVASRLRKSPFMPGQIALKALESECKASSVPFPCNKGRWLDLSPACSPHSVSFEGL